MTASESDTIAAVATAPGRAALAVIRVSGPAAHSIATALADGSGPELEPRVATLRRLVHPATREPLDRSVLTWYPGPSSYTGEDMLEISSHGGTVVPSLILDAVCAAGARPAARGEFTRRAYLNGKLDLLQAEATLDLIDARSPRMGRAALFGLERGLSRRVETLRAALVELQALVAYDIDFPDEDEGPVPPARIDEAIRSLDSDLAHMLRHAPEGELLREGALVVIAGRPNAGKSSLFNALLGTERAIVTEEAGTTRDAIEALVGVDGYPFRLVDTAGIRDDAARIERLGIEVARSYLGHADLALVCIEAGRAAEPAEVAFTDEIEERLGPGRVVVVRTKSDLAPPGNGDGHSGSGDGRRVVRVSAHDGSGLTELRQAMLGAVFSTLAVSEEQPLVTRRRHARSLAAAREAIRAFARTRQLGHPPEISSTHLQDAVLAVEELLGVVTTDDVLDALFSSFCVGK